MICKRRDGLMVAVLYPTFSFENTPSIDLLAFAAFDIDASARTLTEFRSKTRVLQRGENILVGIFLLHSGLL